MVPICALILSLSDDVVDVVVVVGYLLASHFPFNLAIPIGPYFIGFYLWDVHLYDWSLLATSFLSRYLSPPSIDVEISHSLFVFNSSSTPTLSLSHIHYLFLVILWPKAKDLEITCFLNGHPRPLLCENKGRADLKNTRVVLFVCFIFHFFQTSIQFYNNQMRKLYKIVCSTGIRTHAPLTHESPPSTTVGRDPKRLLLVLTYNYILKVFR